MTRRRILVFGDSNSWGWTPGEVDQLSIRYDAQTRWPRVMATVLGEEWEIIEEALSGRTTDLDDPQMDLPVEEMRGPTMNGRRVFPAVLASHLPLDLVIIMLGTNDLKARFHRTPGEIAQAALGLVHLIQVCQGGVRTRYAAPKALLLAPPPVGTTFHHPEEWSGAGTKSLMLGAVFKDSAHAANVPMFDLGDVTGTDGSDAIHLTAEAHRKIGEAIAREVANLFAG